MHIVLILILLEYGLQLFSFVKGDPTPQNVLILILLEYGLQPSKRLGAGLFLSVLILILLEYGLQPLKSQTIDLQTLKT